ncbi:GNAT family N-acetyltransferase [Mucilaginibacter lacusdianchii]|uniref:GNAT family N-acetyltransferase n=1 Tax=Mucilaginibacter lacusdianchii TaxID=2684211 RepID=UPI00131E5840|nr:GNAT family N-acetyltransferase [Mucilaginibacter sp. JXJ CY 39]
MSISYIDRCKSFYDLTPIELYAILRLRNEIFVVEQNCVFQDADNKDQKCHHLMLWQDSSLVAYARLVPPGISYPETSIGRIITSSTVRGTGMGSILLERALEEVQRLFGSGPVRIGAQVYALPFYEKFGFVAQGEHYDEDGIPHVEMVRA